MKSTIIATVIAMTAIPAFAGPTENITGCATMAVEGTNYTVREDVTCALSTDESDGTNIITRSWLEAAFG